MCYDFLDLVLKEDSWITNGTDTDSFCCSFNAPWEECIKDQALYDELSKEYFCSQDDSLSMTLNHEGKQWPISVRQHERRIPGKWKVESEGTFVAWLTAKVALLGLMKPNKKDKFGEQALKISFRGGNNNNFGVKHHWIGQNMKAEFVGTILGQIKAIKSYNKGFKLVQVGDEKRLCTYSQDKSVASFWHDKSIVLPDLIHTALSPL